VPGDFAYQDGQNGGAKEVDHNGQKLEITIYLQQVPINRLLSHGVPNAAI
jgi:hypothetical protein